MTPLLNRTSLHSHKLENADFLQKYNTVIAAYASSTDTYGHPLRQFLTKEVSCAKVCGQVFIVFEGQSEDAWIVRFKLFVMSDYVAGYAGSSLNREVGQRLHFDKP